MTTRDAYRAATLLPFLGLALAAVAAGPAAELPAGWNWVYPTSLTRGVLVYAALAAWLWLQLDRRPLAELERMLWWAPVWYVALGWLLMLMLALLRGRAAELWQEHGRAILLRTAVHFAVGYGYVLLVRVALGRLRLSGRLSDAREVETR
jgi:hypothetical protein